MCGNWLENNNDVNKKLELQISKGYEVTNYLKGNHSIEEMNKSFISWRRETETVLIEIYGDNRKSKIFLLKTDKDVNKFSKFNTIGILTEALNSGVDFIQQIKAEIKNNKTNDIEDSDYLDENSILIIIRRILQNFYKHIQTMYQEDVHGNGTIKKEALDAIQIGNEYDVQRILYSLIRPIFPTARLEVSDDAGYKSIRYDIKIDEYNIVIEVKCTRKSMTERNLTEELGSDAFHYSADYVFFFIYDKENIIRNVDAFIRNYKREKSRFGTNVEAIVNQSINI
ncbi:hypothetical protein [Desnuesiella massiliensis]|uniref:PD-(D/E)XK nuclease domain-containing protein n=1 Tax=Desnuesiella massiliensis TaxID=1650662 RepID=UPI0006E32BD4|nr:hypothetical protein [Desnuesiella massiliensis]